MPRKKDTRSLFPIALFLCLAGTGYALHRDYGIPWDESTQRGYGQLVGRYVLGRDAGLFSDQNRVYGPAHEVALIAAETVLHVRDTSAIFALRHLCNFLVFAAGVVALYRIGLKGLKSIPASLLLCVALVLSPPIFAHAFYNSKDLPFLAFFIISANSLLNFLERPRVSRTLAHALASSWLIAIRVPGLLIPAFTVALAAHCAFRTDSSELRRRRLSHLALYLVATAVLTWALWPTLWRHPLTSLWEAMQTMSQFPWNADVLYAGRLLPASELPWHYALVWIAITTPPLYLIVFLAGLPIAISRAWRAVRTADGEAPLFALLIACWFFVPLMSVIGLQSTMYDGWRHLFFIYPAMLLIAMQGVLSIGRTMRVRWTPRATRLALGAIGVVAAISAASTLRFMIAAHPFEQLYFNSFIGGIEGARFKFELDYWGLSYRRGFETVLERDRDPVIPIFIADPAAAWNAHALPYAQRRRLLFVNSADEAKYFAGAYRLQQKEYEYDRILSRVTVSGVPVLTVAVLHPEMSLTADTVPALIATMQQNMAATSATDTDGLLAATRQGLQLLIGRAVRRAETISVEPATSGPADLRQGHLASVRVRLHGAEVGDLRSNAPGVPVADLDVTLTDLVIDIARLQRGEVALARLGGIAINSLVLDADAINTTLAARQDKLKDARVHFGPGGVTVERLGRPSWSINLLAWIGPDPWKPASENLWFEVDRVRMNGWTLPVASLVNLFAGNYSPAIDPDKLPARVILGTLRLEAGRLSLGTPVR